MIDRLQSSSEAALDMYESFVPLSSMYTIVADDQQAAELKNL